MKSFKIAAVQYNSVVGDKASNLNLMISWTRKAKKAGAKLVMFPELNISGHAGSPAMVSEAEIVPQGKSVKRLEKLTKELDIYICAGIAEDDLGIHYNCQFIVGPKGYLGKQRKVHLSADEAFYFRGGTATPVYELALGRIAMIICADNLYPEMARCLAVKGAEVLLCPHAARCSVKDDGTFTAIPDDLKIQRKFVYDNKEKWKLIHRERASSNGCYVVLCNTAGKAAVHLEGVNADHAGGCMIIDPYGEVIAESKTKDIEEEMIVTKLDAEAVAKIRHSACFNLQNRRPEVFKILSEPTF